MESVQLHYKDYGRGFPLIILHGLFGSLDNWQTIAKELSERFHVYILDQRNHGKSPHTDAFNYHLLAADLHNFLQEHQLPQAHIMGHSMGGKAAMAFALQYPQQTAKLIVVDIAPSAYEDRHTYIMRALEEANIAEAASREQVRTFLRSRLSDGEATIQFLMKGLTRSESGKGFVWKFNLASLHRNYGAIAGAVMSARPFRGQVLFIKGEKSDYLNAAAYQEASQLFPQSRLIEIAGAGHWVHAERPKELMETVVRFLQ